MSQYRIKETREVGSDVVYHVQKRVLFFWFLEKEFLNRSQVRVPIHFSCLSDALEYIVNKKSGVSKKQVKYYYQKA